MKKVSIFATIFLLTLISLWALNNKPAPKEVEPQIKITDELRKKYPIKPHHQKISLRCTDCHENQGNDPEKFEFIDDEGCLSCHGSKEKIAKRTGYKDLFHTNPHNSYHDGPTLNCDECHHVHEPSVNMCIECHEKEVPKWMKKVTP